MSEDVGKEDYDRYRRETDQWQGPKLVVLLVVTLAFAMAALWFMADWSQNHFAP